MAEREAVTVLGLGAMGRALAGAFAGAGHPVTVWNRTPGRAGDLLGRGVTEARTVSDAVAAGPLVIICVLDYEAVHAVLDPVAEAGALHGRTLVNLTNGTPGQARATAERAERHGACYLDGGIMAVPPMIGTPQAVLLHSGDEEAYAGARPALEVLGTSRYLGGDPGQAALYDIALLSGMYGMFAGVAQALALIRGGPMPPEEFTASLLLPWLEGMMTAVPEIARQVETGDHVSAVVSSLGMQTVAFGNLTETAAEQGVRGDLLGPLHALMREGVAAGHGAEDLSRLVELLREPPGDGTTAR